MIDLDISKLKAISSGATEQISHANEKKSFEDTRFWKPERDKNGNGSAVIRFLPSLEAGKLPWVHNTLILCKDSYFLSSCLFFYRMSGNFGRLRRWKIKKEALHHEVPLL